MDSAFAKLDRARVHFHRLTIRSQPLHRRANQLLGRVPDTCQKGVQSVLVERGVSVVSLVRLLSTVFRSLCGERCFTVLGRTGPAASRARRAAHYPAASFNTRSLLLSTT
jgi:hypothetical protein